MSHPISHSFASNLQPPPRPSPPIACPPHELAERYAAYATAIESRHSAQTLDDVMALREKYAKPTFGAASPWSLVQMLGQCIDPSDQRLYCASQQLHVLQIIDALEVENAATPEMLLLALVHDLGKVLLLTDEAPENVVCMNRPVATGVAGCGLDRCVLQWNHDEWAYMRLKDHLPDPLAWLVRYHSIVPAACIQYMDARDREYCNRYLKPFARFDHESKTPLNLPPYRIDHYRAIIERALPLKLDF